MHAHVKVESIAKKLEILTRCDETKRLLIVSISDTAKTPIWCNETIPLEADKILIV